MLADGENFRQRLWRATVTIVAVMGLPILMLLALVALLFQSTGWVDHTDRVISEAYRLEKIMFNAQGSFRGFRLAGDEVYLRPYLAARDEVPQELQVLRGLTADNPVQGRALVQLEGEIRATFDYTSSELDAIRTGRVQVRDGEFIRTSAPLFEKVQASLDEFIQREHGLRVVREESLRRWRNATLIVFGVALLIGLPVAARWLRRLLRGITRSYRDACSAAERRAAELQVTLTSIGDAVIATDAEGRVEFLNPVAEALTGWTNAEAAGRMLPEVFRIFNERTGVMVDNPVERVLRENITVGLANHTVLRSRDGQDRSIEDSAAPIRAEDGEVRGAILVFHDVSARRDEERLLEESEERFRLLAQMVSLQVWTAGADGNFDYANEECAKYFGGDLNRDVLGTAWEQFVHPDDRASGGRAWKTALASGQPLETEFRLRSHAGEYRWFLVRAQARRDAAGHVTKWFGTNTDIDALRRAKSEAERASRSKDEFIATLSHELRTPLTPVLMTAAALREDARLTSDVREQLGMIERNIALEARLIDDLLDVTALSKGKMRLRSQLSDVHSLIGLAVEIVRDEAQIKEVAIQRKLSAVRSGSHVDPARFQQVIWNLLRNAVKFTPRGGQISLASRDTLGADGTPWLEIEIADTGLGINPTELEKIFQPFEQGGRTGDHRYGGLGLGLAIARAIVDLHGGRIAARSGGPNQGATFVIELPGAVPPPLGHHEVRVTDAGRVDGSLVGDAGKPPMRQLRLLLVEDHDATLLVLSRLLTGVGHRVTVARTMAEAWEKARGESFDAVISDLGLPDGTGAELMERLRETYGLRGIALSGYGMEEDLVRSRNAGFVAHIIKPVDFAQLRRVLAEVAG